MLGMDDPDEEENFPGVSIPVYFSQFSKTGLDIDSLDVYILMSSMETTESINWSFKRNGTVFCLNFDFPVLKDATIQNVLLKKNIVEFHPRRLAMEQMMLNMKQEKGTFNIVLPFEVETDSRFVQKDLTKQDNLVYLLMSFLKKSTKTPEMSIKMTNAIFL